METYSHIFAWEIPWSEETGRLQSLGLQRVKPDLVTSTNEQQQKFIVYGKVCSVLERFTGLPNAWPNTWHVSILSVSYRIYRPKYPLC